MVAQQCECTCWHRIVHLKMVKMVNFTLCMFCCSLTSLCPTISDHMDCRMPGFPILRCLLEFAQTHVHRVSDAIQPSHPLSPTSPPASIFPTIRVFSNESALPIRWPKYWSFSTSLSSEYSGLISFRID